MNNESNRIFKWIIPVILILLIIGVTAGTAIESTKTANIRPNVAGSFNPTIERPVI